MLSLTRNTVFGYSAAILALMISLLLKTKYLAFYPSLWGEDTSVFIKGALENGFTSVFIPANGFNHLIQRIVALVVVYLPLSFAEITFHLFALAAACFTSAVIWRFAPISTALGRLVACAALPFLPTNSLEIWFTLVNVHWYLAIALALLITSPLSTSSDLKWPWLVSIFLMCLSGPFSVLMAPVVLARAIVLGDLRRGKLFYAVYLTATFIQTLTVFFQARGRLSSIPSDSVSAWVQGVFGNAFLGFFTTKTLLLIAVASIAFALRFTWARFDKAARFQMVALAFIILVHVVASFYSFKQYPELIGPYKLHARYFIIPYGIGVILLLATGRGWTTYLTIALVIAICYSGYRPFHHIDLAPAEADRAAGAGRSPTYLATYIRLAHHVGQVKFFGRPATEDFVLPLSDHAPVAVPFERKVAAEDLRSGIISVPPQCSSFRAISVIFDVSSRIPGARVSINASRDYPPSPYFNVWFQQFHEVALHKERQAFALPNSGVHTLRLTLPSDAEIGDGRLLCY